MQQLTSLQRQGRASYKGRQQPFGRYRAVCKGTGLPGAQGHYWQRSRIHAVCWIRDNPPVRAPLAQDSDAGHHGSPGGAAERIDESARWIMYVWIVSEYAREQKMVKQKLGLGRNCRRFDTHTSGIRNLVTARCRRFPDREAIQP